MTTKTQNRDNIFHVRANILREHGYQGFSVTNTREKWNGIQITVENSDGRTIMGWGENKDEAYANIIDNIDQVLEEPY